MKDKDLLIIHINAIVVDGISSHSNDPVIPEYSGFIHYNDVIMSTTASQATTLGTVCPTVYSDADQRKRQSSASLAFAGRIHRWSVTSPHKGPLTRNVSIWWRHYVLKVLKRMPIIHLDFFYKNWLHQSSLQGFKSVNNLRAWFGGFILEFCLIYQFLIVLMFDKLDWLWSHLSYGIEILILCVGSWPS